MSKQRQRAPRARPEIGPGPVFWGLSVTLGLLLFASSAPTPLYVVYQDEWGFSDLTLTAVFAVYAIALLASLLIAGSVSDHVGRRPTLRVALVVEALAMLLFAGAQGVGWLFAARTVQGVATGIATGAISAALLDLQPEASPRLGALLGVVAPLAGLAVGALSAGLLVEYAPSPERLVFVLLLAGFALALGLTSLVPESAGGERLRPRMLKPRVHVPDSLRVAFVAAIPCLVATWALGGLFLSLGPSLTAGVLGNASHVVGGLPIALMAGMSVLASVRMRDSHARATARGGLTALIAGVAIALLALQLGSTALFLAGAAVAGLGFGPAFSGAFRALSNRAPLDRRAALVSAILVVSYLAFSLPAVVAGAGASQLGLREMTDVYGIALICTALLALLLSHRMQDPQSE